MLWKIRLVLFLLISFIYILESQDIHLFILRLRGQHQYFNRTDLYSSHMDDSPLLYSRMKAMFDSYLPPVVCRRAHVLFMLFIIVRYTNFLPFCKQKDSTCINGNKKVWFKTRNQLQYYNCFIQTLFFCSVLDTTLCDKVCQRPAAARWFSPCTPVSFINKTDRHDIAEILLKVALITLTICSLHFRPWHLAQLQQQYDSKELRKYYTT